MNFRTFFIYIASVFILSRCVSGHRNSIPAHDHRFTDAELDAQIAGQEASIAHHRVADAHFNRAFFWQTRNAKRSDAHKVAGGLHRDRAKRLESHYHSILPGGYSNPDLLAFKRQCLSSKEAANAGLTQLDASNAYKKTYELAEGTGDRVELAMKVVAHDKKSLDHIPPSAGDIIHSRMSISDGEDGIRRAKQLSQEYRDLGKRESGEASRSTHH